MQWAVRRTSLCVSSVFIVAEALAEENSSLGWHFCEAVRADKRGDGDQGIVSEVHHVTGKDAAGSGPHTGENNSHHDQYGYDAPRPAQLVTVHQSKKHPCHDDARRNTKRTREERVEIAAKKRLLYK